MKKIHAFPSLFVLAFLAACSPQPAESSLTTPSESGGGEPSSPSGESSFLSEPSASPESSLPDTSYENISSYAPPNVDDVSVKDLPGKSRTFYQLLVYSFADGNGDGIGDFKGIIDHLDYLENLGIGGIWLSPIHEADSYHAYDVTDYYSVNHRYEVTVNGKAYTLDTLLAECHDRGIKVLLDLVLNHSSPNCSWYSQHRDWYASTDAFYGMKDFNFDNQELRTEIKNVGKYWLNKGVDGFRLDAAKWVYNLGAVDTSADDAKNYVWWKEFYDECKTVKSDVYMIAEVLSNASDCVNYYNTMMDADFNFGMRDKIYDAALYASPSNYTSFVETYQKAIRQINPAAIESSVISNHDIGRYQNFNGANLTGGKLALAGLLNVLAPGDSYVYYGDELGMDGKCEGTSKNYYNDLNFRTPMPFSSGRTNPQNYLYSSVPSKNMTSTLYNNETIENSSFFAVYQKAIKAKNRASVLYNGVVSKGGNGGNSEVASYFAEKGNESATVIFNCGSSWKRGQVSGGSAILGEASLEGVSHYENGSITLAPYSAMILQGKATLSSISKIDTQPTTSSSSNSSASLEIDPPGQEIFSEAAGNLLIHCKNTNSWSKMNCYAWVDKNQYCGAWPGSAMSKDGDWYTISIPHGAANLIFNDGTNQTENLHRPSEGEYWFLMAEGSGKSISGDWYRKNPDF